MVERKKIVILGGGVAAMTSAFYLTNQKDWQLKYDITVYQLGWRIGGKGASGRNADYGDRIEEHGLHIWFGFYDNGFHTMKQAYHLLQRPEGAPLRTWQDAFKEHSFICLEEYIDKQWKTWPIEFPTNNLEPGGIKDSGEEIDLWDLFRTAFMWIKKFLSEAHLEAAKLKATNPMEKETDESYKPWLKRVADTIKVDANELVGDVNVAIKHLDSFLKQLPAELENHHAEDHEAIKGFMKSLRNKLRLLLCYELNNHDELRRLFISADLGLTILIGMLEDDVFTQGFNVINNYDYKEWLRKHGANEKYTVNSAPVRGFYDLVFAFEKGNTEKPNIEAGTIIRSMMRIALTYKGAIMWKMQAGMGDTIFTPFYQTLKDRGVKFEYFHKVDELVANNGSVEQILITQQVALNESLVDYNPLVEVPVKGYELPLACWPDRPNYQQLDFRQAALLQEHSIDLESFWTDWPEIYQNKFGQPLPRKVLQKGVDFDEIIYGISVASLPHLCPSLLAQSPALKTMSDKVKTVVTQAYQVWGDKTLKQMGWAYTPTDGEEPVLSGFVEPFDTWASMDQLIAKENWPPQLQPKNIAYFCSAMPVEAFPPPSDHQFPLKCANQVKNNAINNLTDSIYNLWPSVAQPGEFDWTTLIDPHNQQGQERFNSQFWKANIDPSEQYVLSVKNSTQYRLDTDKSGFDNFYITGDWIKTGLNIGCVEAAVMAGMLTSRAICGHPEHIAGLKDF